MEQQPCLSKQKSTIPTSCSVLESGIIPMHPDKVWELVKSFSLDKMIPKKVHKSEFISGGAGQVGAIVRIEYMDKAVWELRLTEVSDKRRSISYEVISTEPSLSVTSMDNTITIRHITSDNTSFVEWFTIFSNDADSQVIEDSKFKKRDCLKEMKEHC